MAPLSGDSRVVLRDLETAPINVSIELFEPILELARAGESDADTLVDIVTREFEAT
jgi:hypothetical protein